MDVVERECKHHGLTRYAREKCSGYYRCVKCRNAKTTRYRKDRIDKLKRHFGGKCALCGYDRCLDALDFHHEDPDEKEFSFREKRYLAWDKLVAEAKSVSLSARTAIERYIHRVADQLHVALWQRRPGVLGWEQLELGRA